MPHFHKNQPRRLQTKTALEVKPLKFAYSRLNSLLRTLEVTHLDEYNPLQVRVTLFLSNLPAGGVACLLACCLVT